MGIIIFSAINEDGSVLGLSTSKSLNLYETSLPKLSRDNVSSFSIAIRKLAELDFYASCMAFLENQLFFATDSLKICSIDCNRPEVPNTLTVRGILYICKAIDFDRKNSRLIRTECCLVNFGYFKELTVLSSFSFQFYCEEVIYLRSVAFRELG